VHVVQGERPLARDNRTLGRFQLVGIPPAPRGQPQIEVTFDIDSNGILNVSARDAQTGKQQAITITASSGLEKDEVDRMVKEAQSHAADDARRREEIELRNQVDSLLYQTERMFQEHGGKLADTERQTVDHALNDARDAIKTQDADRLRRAQQDLQQTAQIFAAAAQRQQTQTRAAGAGAGGGFGGNGGGAGGGRPQGQGQGSDHEGDGDVIDAEFEDVDDKGRT
jgi:molecular chaperone DnaK